MKDFIKWLGVNEKVARVSVWLLIIMVSLIIVNSALASIGFPNYQITYNNLIQIKDNIKLEYLVAWTITLLNFYSILLLIFEVKEYKKLFKYSLLYLILNIIITTTFNTAVAQLFIVMFFTIFSYFYSNKNKKYIIYAIMSVILNIIIQGIAYYFKVRLIDFEQLNRITQGILSIDYFIIMGIIILVKEILLKKKEVK